ncbi:MAG: hypothetical protein FJX76_20650 [Armatimonadetes bacterium]|nr:hypothetical protein [Armatimonadota bacterium]
MILIYCPSALSAAARRELEQALERDGARVYYSGSDGSDEYLIMESSHFEKTREVERRHGLALAWQQARADDSLEALLENARRARSKKARGKR